MNRPTAVLLTLLSISAIHGSAFAQVAIPAKYNLIPLNTTGVASINNNGVVAGATTPKGSTVRKAYHWTIDGVSVLNAPNTTTTSFQDAEVDNNGNSFFVGSATFPITFKSSAILVKNGVVTYLGTLGGAQGYAAGANRAGKVVGYSFQSTGAQRAFLYQNGAMLNLGTLGGAASVAMDINDSDVVVGFSRLAPPSVATRGFISRNVGGSWVMQAIGTLGGYNSNASSINNSGVIVGQADTITGKHGYLFANNVMTSIGTLGGRISNARSINNNGFVVGESTNSGGATLAVVYYKGTLVNLNTRLANANGWVLNSAYKINDRGQIVAIGTKSGVTSAFVLDPM